MHAKYKVSIPYGSKVIAKVKVDNRQTDRQTDKQTNRQTGEKQYAPDHSIWGYKKHWQYIVAQILTWSWTSPCHKQLDFFNMSRTPHHVSHCHTYSFQSEVNMLMVHSVGLNSHHESSMLPVTSWWAFIIVYTIYITILINTRDDIVTVCATAMSFSSKGLYKYDKPKKMQ